MGINVSMYLDLYMLAVSLFGSADILAAFVVIKCCFLFFSFVFCNSAIFLYTNKQAKHTGSLLPKIPNNQTPTHNNKEWHRRRVKKTKKKKSEIDIFAQIAVNKDWSRTEEKPRQRKICLSKFG